MIVKTIEDRGWRIARAGCMLRAIFYPLSSILAFSCFPGCNIVGAIAAKAGPEPTIKAQFALAKESTLVLVENYHNPASLRLESDAVARTLAAELALHEVGPVIDPGRAETLRHAKGEAYRAMPLDAIGQKLGAKQVIYVDLVRFEIGHALASDLLGGDIEARVRVVDDAGTLLWPIDSAGGFPVAVKVQPQRVPPGVGDADVRRKMHAALADKVAKLFYDWKGESSDGQAEQF